MKKKKHSPKSSLNPKNRSIKAWGNVFPVILRSSQNAAREISLWQDTRLSIMIQIKSPKTTRNLWQFREAFSSTSSPFLVFFSEPCSVEKCQAGPAYCTVLIGPAVDQNLLCTILGMLKRARCWEVYSSFMGKLYPSNLLLYISNDWRIQLQKMSSVQVFSEMSCAHLGVLSPQFHSISPEHYFMHLWLGPSHISTS